MRATLNRFVCFVGAHPVFSYEATLTGGLVRGGTRTCLACGRVYRDTYDGMEQSWVRVGREKR